MRFNTYINNTKCLEWGLTANQGALFDLLNQLSSWATEVIMEGKVFYHISRNKVIKEIPLFYSKSDTVYRHFKLLESKGLIVFFKQGKNDLICLTPKGKEWNLNPQLGFESEETRISIQKNSDSNPTYNNTIHNNTSNKELSLNFDKIEKKKFVPPLESEVIKYFEENGYTKEAGQKSFKYYDSANWKDAKGNQVKNWKQKMIGVWFKPENKRPESGNSFNIDDYK